MSDRPGRILSARGAYTLEMTIVIASILALMMIFQPFSLALFTIGAAAVVIVGLAFNLVPLCRPGVPVRSLVKGTVAIVVIFAIVTALSLASAELYAFYISPVN
jgi:hypothetical protein